MKLNICISADRLDGLAPNTTLRVLTVMKEAGFVVQDGGIYECSCRKYVGLLASHPGELHRALRRVEQVLSVSDIQDITYLM